MDQLLASLFARVRNLMDDFISRIGGGPAVTMSRAAFREACKELRKIEDTLRAALSTMAVDVVLPPLPPKPTATPSADRAAPKPAATKPTPCVGVFNPCMPLDTPAEAPKSARSVSAPRTPTETPEPTTESLLRRIARMQAVLDNPLPYAERVARHIDETAKIGSPDVMEYALKLALPPDLASDPNVTSYLLALQPKWPPG
ncbi:hypothetical protein [Hyphomonas chukchiensis]|uniref:Uncharacterized protein n=1 Tax=Hyphomonas chukchiensis TaxID=1280947 RepID=A0A062U9U5_9PROT|nr:hypothetical protein [Hyphomonas chukchiensis]KCZ54508.1 hypothetical protein HY30_09485 [Hyphomonas chukchiensis]|tara:strand:- start:1047 stop:1649 length:603 start_codon:yes stop_codon:yes gene_type:complete